MQYKAAKPALRTRVSNSNSPRGRISIKQFMGFRLKKKCP